MAVVLLDPAEDESSEVKDWLEETTGGPAKLAH